MRYVIDRAHFPLQNRLMDFEKLVKNAVANGDPTAFFEQLYAGAELDPSKVPWGGWDANTRLIEWFEQHQVDGTGRTACIVGCGLGGDAEAFAARGFTVTAFDVSETAIAWCKQRFPESSVAYVVADMFEPPAGWVNHFDFVLDVRIVQALPLTMRKRAISAEINLVAPDGELLIITARRDDAIIEPAGPPWPLSRSELTQFAELGLDVVKVEALTDYADRWRGHFRKPSAA